MLHIAVLIKLSSVYFGLCLACIPALVGNVDFVPESLHASLVSFKFDTVEVQLDLLRKDIVFVFTQVVDLLAP